MGEEDQRKLYFARQAQQMSSVLSEPREMDDARSSSYIPLSRPSSLASSDRVQLEGTPTYPTSVLASPMVDATIGPTGVPETPLDVPRQLHLMRSPLGRSSPQETSWDRMAVIPPDERRGIHTNCRSPVSEPPPRGEESESQRPLSKKRRRLIKRVKRGDDLV